MSIQHKDIIDPNIHEPKGIASAGSDMVYVCTGAGTGVWKKLSITSLVGAVGTGTSGQSVMLDGDGGITQQWGVARGSASFVNIASPYSLTFPTAYTKVNPTTTIGDSPIEIAQVTNARLAYTGSITRKGIIDAEVCLSHSAGANRDIRLAVYKNGSLISVSESIITAVSGNKHQLCISVETTLSSGDYFEVFMKNDGADGNISVYTYRMSITAF